MRPKCLNAFQRFYSIQKVAKPKICVVGSGPAGFYAAQHLLKKLDSPTIDIFEKLPVPFGLVRFGVAPDHPEVKNVEHTFTKTAESPNVNFYGNVSLGNDVSVQELLEAYHIVLLSYGAEENRKLNIPGENLRNVISAKNIVGWYNGFPSDANLEIDLESEAVAIFGQGNVAIDVGRILLSPLDLLKKTDITQNALEKLSESKVKKVYLVGRRGPLQAAFTIKELREMLKLQNCATRWQPDSFTGISEIIPNLARPRKRITELMLKSLNENKDKCDKLFEPVFCRSPLELMGSSRVEKVKLGVNNLIGDDLLHQNAELTSRTETLDCDLAVVSIGYKSINADNSIPFDSNKGIVSNKAGKISKSLYATGWLATGPTGVILTTMSTSFAVAENIVRDIKAENLVTEEKPGFGLIGKKLTDKNLQIVTWKDWCKINKYEIDSGNKIGKPREKVVNISKMLEIANS